jgi:membrane peptidoglycan carboxypeptidase
MAQQIGLGGHIPHVPSVVLGTAETTPLDVTSAFATFATLGSHPMPRLVTRVLDSQGQVVWSQEPSSTGALDPAVAFIVTSMLKDVVDHGTATAVRAAGFRGVAAGKTGTTNDAADIWFVGYTPRVVGTIWLGFDKRSTVVRGATGGELAAPIWGRIMARLDESNVDWAVPSGVETRMVDDMGNVYAENCPLLGPTHEDYFLAGTAPLATCYADPGYMYMDTMGYPVDTLLLNDEWWRRLRRRFLRDRDTMYIDTVTPVPPVRDTLRRDTIKLRPDTARPWITDTTRKPPRDTVRRDTLPKPPPDTVRRDTLPNPPRDTTQRDTLFGAEWRVPRI